MRLYSASSVVSFCSARQELAIRGNFFSLLSRIVVSGARCLSHTAHVSCVRMTIVHHVLLQTWYSADSIVCNGLWSGACCLPRVLKKWCARVVAVFAWEWFPDFLECFLWCPEVRLILACDASLKRASCFIAMTVFLLGTIRPSFHPSYHLSFFPRG